MCMSVSEGMVLTRNRENRFHGTAARVECLLREIFGRRKEEVIEVRNGSRQPDGDKIVH